jgi:uncharacterized protein (TIGR02001 family)
MRKPKGRNFARGVARPATAHGLAFVAAVIWSSGALAQQAPPLDQQADTSTPAMPPLVVKAEPPPRAPATEAASTFDAKFSAGITSDYNYRGYTLSNHLPSVSANGEADYDIFFASVNVASVQMPGLSHFQMTDTVGLRRAFGALTMETGGAIYSYPGFANDPSYAEVYFSPSYKVTKDLTAGVNVFYAPDYYRMGAWENYNSLALKYDIGWGLSFSTEVGRQSFGTTHAGIKLPDYTYANAGFSYTYKSLTFDLRYHATTLTKQSCFLITGTGSAVGGSNGCDQAVIASLSWNAGQADFKAASAGLK